MHVKVSLSANVCGQASILVQVYGRLRVWGRFVDSTTWQWHLIDGVSRPAIAPALQLLTGARMLLLCACIGYIRLVGPVFCTLLNQITHPSLVSSLRMPGSLAPYLYMPLW